MIFVDMYVYTNIYIYVYLHISISMSCICHVYACICHVYVMYMSCIGHVQSGRSNMSLAVEAFDGQSFLLHSEECGLASGQNAMDISELVGGDWNMTYNGIMVDE